MRQVGIGVSGLDIPKSVKIATVNGQDVYSPVLGVAYIDSTGDVVVKAMDHNGQIGYFGTFESILGKIPDRAQGGVSYDGSFDNGYGNGVSYVDHKRVRGSLKGDTVDLEGLRGNLRIADNSRGYGMAYVEYVGNPVVRIEFGSAVMVEEHEILVGESFIFPDVR